MSRKPTTDPNRAMSIPLLFAFRDAAQKRDAKKVLDERDGGERVLTKRGSLARTGAREPELKRDLSIDLSALVNTINLASVTDLRKLPRVRKSVLNYGLDDIGHMTSEEQAVSTIATDLKTALLQHEPRLDDETLDVVKTEEIDEENQRVRFQVAAEMAAKPLPIPVEFTAEVDVSSGKVLLSKLPGTA